MQDLANLFQKAFDAGVASSVPVPLPDGSVGHILPDGMKLVKSPPLDPILTHIKQSVRLHDEDSFGRYIRAYAGNATRLFASPGYMANGSPVIVAVIDYHVSAVGDIQSPTPGRMAHRVTYNIRYSEQWAKWKAIANGERTLKQLEFAEFIEENRNDIVEPSAAQILDIVRKFKASKKVEFDSLVTQANGDTMLMYSEKTEQIGTSGPIPERLMIGIPVYYGGQVRERVGVFLRFRVANGAVVFQLKLDQPNLIEDTAFADITNRLTTELALPIHIGEI